MYTISFAGIRIYIIIILKQKTMYTIIAEQQFYGYRAGQNSLFGIFLSQIFALQTAPSLTHWRNVISSAAPAQEGLSASLTLVLHTSAKNSLHPLASTRTGLATQNSLGYFTSEYRKKGKEGVLGCQRGWWIHPVRYWIPIYVSGKGGPDQSTCCSV